MLTLCALQMLVLLLLLSLLWHGNKVASYDNSHTVHNLYSICDCAQQTQSVTVTPQTSIQCDKFNDYETLKYSTWEAQWISQTNHTRQKALQVSRIRTNTRYQQYCWIKSTPKFNSYQITIYFHMFVAQYTSEKRWTLNALKERRDGL